MDSQQLPNGREVAALHDWIHLKCDAEAFEAMAAGRKLFDYREIRDRPFAVGRAVMLWEHGPAGCTGRRIWGVIQYQLNGPCYGVPLGYCVMGFNEREFFYESNIAPEHWPFGPEPPKKACRPVMRSG